MSAPTPTVVFRLYTAGNSPNSMRARQNLLTFCESMLRGQSEVEIIDVFAEPSRAVRDEVFVTPLLIVQVADSFCRICGDLSDVSTLAQVLQMRE